MGRSGEVSGEVGRDRAGEAKGAPRRLRRVVGHAVVLVDQLEHPRAAALTVAHRHAQHAARRLVHFLSGVVVGVVHRVRLA